MIEKDFTLRDLATLFEAVDASETSPVRRALLAMARHEPFATMYRQIEQLAEDAGTPRHLEGWEFQAVEDNLAFDHLLSSEPWDDPAAALQMQAPGIDLGALLGICQARRKRGEGDAERLSQTEQKLRAAVSFPPCFI